MSGLEQEIEISNVTVPVGQTLIHGRGDRFPRPPAPYPSFVSASLDPVVALNHARKRAAHGGSGIVYALTAGMELPATWGHAGRTVEWEILLPTGLPIEEVQATFDGEFAVIERRIIGRRTRPGSAA